MKLAYATVESDHCSDDDFLESGQKPKMQEKAVKAAVTATRVLPEQLRGFFPSVAAAHAALEMWELQYGKKRKIIRMIAGKDGTIFSAAHRPGLLQR